MADTSITVRLIDETRLGIADIKRNIGSLDDATNDLTRTVKGFVAAWASLEGGRFLYSQIDDIQTMDNKLRLVTKSQEEFEATYQKVFDVAQRTRAPLGETIDLYTKMERASGQLGLTSGESTKVTEAFNKALALSGANSAAASGAITQFAQALQSGKFQGDEFRSISETIPQILDIISKKTGIAREDLKQYASDGLITGKIAAIALIESLEDLDKQFGTQSKTVSQATTQLVNEFKTQVRAFMETSGVADGLVSVIDHIRENMDNLVPIVKVLGIAVAALAVYFAPVTAAIVAAGVAIVAFADVVGPLAKLLLDGLGGALEFVIKTVGGLYKAVMAIVDFANPIKAFKEGFDEASLSVGGAKKAQDALGETTKQLGTETASTTERSNRMNLAMRESGAAAKLASSAYGDYLMTLSQSIQLAALDSKERELQTSTMKALEAKAKDLKIPVDELTEAQRNQVVEETKNLVTRKQIVEEQRKLLDTYTKAVEDSQTKYLTGTEKYIAEADKMESDYRKSGLDAEEKYLGAREALRRQYYQTYADMEKKAQEMSLTETEKYTKAILDIEKANQAGIFSTRDEYQRALEAANTIHNKKLWDEAEKARTSEMGAFGTYSAKMKELNDAYNAGRFQSDEQYYLLANKARQEYADATVREYSMLYKTVEDSLLKTLNVNKEKWPMIKEVIKLFGVDSDKILKDVFTQAIEYIKGFTTSGSTNLKGFQTSTGSIFDSLGDVVSGIWNGGLTSIGTFISKGLDLLGGFGSSISSIFNGIGSFLGNLFGSGGSAISTVTSGLSSIVSTVSTVVSAVGGGLSTVATTIGSALGIGGAAAGAAGGAAAGAGAAVGGAAMAGGAAAVGGAAMAGGAAAGAGAAGSAAAGTAAAGAGVGSALLATGGLLLGGALLIKLLSRGAVPEKTSYEKDVEASQGYINKLNEFIQNEYSKAAATSAGYLDGSYSRMPGYYALTSNKRGEEGKQLGEYRQIDTYGLRNWFQSTFYPQNTSIRELIGKYSWQSNMPYYNNITASSLSQTGLYGWYLQEGEKYFGGRKFGAQGLAYDNGSLINRATMFATKSGMAVGGELGTEAIMPLSRGPDGTLGVQVHGASGGDINVNFTINAIDSRGIEELLIKQRSLITNIVRDSVRQRGVKI